MNCTGRPLDHFIGHKRMNSITLVVQEHFSSWVKIAKRPFKNLASSSHSTEKEHILIIFPFSPPLRTSSQSKLASLARALFYSLAIHHPSLSISLPFAFKLIVRTFIFAVWTERTSLTMASICPDPDGSLLSQFPSILLLHINSGQDYLPACLSRCSRETGKKKRKKERAQSLSTRQSAVRAVGWQFALTLLYSRVHRLQLLRPAAQLQKIKRNQKHTQPLPNVLGASEK